MTSSDTPAPARTPAHAREPSDVRASEVRASEGLDAGDARVVVDLRAESMSVGVVDRGYRRVLVRREIVTEEVSVLVTVRREVLSVVHEDLVDDAPAPFVLGPADEEGDGVPRAVPEGGAGAGAGRRRAAPRTLEIVLHEERPVVGVEVVPVERVTLRTVRREALGVVRGAVRHEEVELDVSSTERPGAS